MPLQPGQIDPGEQTIIAIVGRKHSGKSKLARYLAATYPYDQVVIDLHGDDRPAELADRDSGVVEISEAPPKWPEHLRVEEKPLVLYFQPDAGSSTLQEDMDAALGLAYAHGRCMVTVHEWGALAVVHRTPPMTSRTLSQGRKRKTSLLMLMHRPHNVDELTFVQADMVICFEVPNKRDREKLANGIGWPPDDFEAALAELQPYEYLLFDRRIPRPEEGQPDLRLTSWPALSREELREVMRPAPEPAP